MYCLSGPAYLPLQAMVFAVTMNSKANALLPAALA
jgi:hypothetical protein